MLYRYEDEGRVIRPVPYYDYSELQRNEKDLENLLANHFGELSLMPIFQERAMQEEPDIFALDAQGNLVIFELKRGNAGSNAVEQIMKYATLFGRSSYAQLNDKYKSYKNDDNVELQAEHALEFELSV
ncbi:MAG: DUF91 domain-containing protein, partial [Synergistaceae bacterium]|nr:DUF91 domain-containing protein [Synergistaceae bacterium]